MAHREAVAVTINGVNRSGYVMAASGVEWVNLLQQTGSARWKMAGIDGDWVPLVGEQFGIYDTAVPSWGTPPENGLLFAGSIDAVTPERPSAVQPTWITVEITGSSREQILQRRLVRPAAGRLTRYKQMTAGAIAQALLADFCSGEGLILEPANFDAGPEVDFVAFNHQTVAECMTQIADYAGLHWWVAPDFRIYLREREAVPAPWGIVDGEANCDRLAVRESRENLSNAIFYRAAYNVYATDSDPLVRNPTVETIVSTAGQRFFQTILQMGEAIEVKVESAAGEGAAPSTIAQSDNTAAQFWYLPGDNGFSLSSGQADLAVGSRVTIRYNRLGGDIIPREDAIAISDRAAVEGSSGRYELAVGNTANLSKVAAEQRAQAIINRRRYTALVIEGETRRPGLEVGMALIVSRTNPPVNDTFLLTAITARTMPGTSQILYQFSGVNGAKLPNGWDFFTGLGDSGFGGGFGAGFRESVSGAIVGGSGAGAGSGLADFFREIPIGAIDGANREFKLTYLPASPYPLQLILNQTMQYPKSNATAPGPIPRFQYALANNRVIYEVAPQPGDVHEVLYWRDPWNLPPDCSKPAAETPLDPDGPLYAAIVQAWLFAEGAGATTRESLSGATATIDLAVCQWIPNGSPDGTGFTLESNGGMAYPAEPADEPWVPPLPSSTPKPPWNAPPPPPPFNMGPIVGPSGSVGYSDGFSIFIVFRGYDRGWNHNVASSGPSWIVTKGNFVTAPGNQTQGFYIGFLADNFSPSTKNGIQVAIWLDDSDSVGSGIGHNAALNLTPWNDGEWHSLVLTYNGAINSPTVPFQAWWDGEFQTSLGWSTSPRAGAMIEDLGPLRICGVNAFANSMNGCPFFGQIDTLQIYNRVLTAAEAEALAADPYLAWRQC